MAAGSRIPVLLLFAGGEWSREDRDIAKCYKTKKKIGIIIAG